MQFPDCRQTIWLRLSCFQVAAKWCRWRTRLQGRKSHRPPNNFSACPSNAVEKRQTSSSFKKGTGKHSLSLILQQPCRNSNKFALQKLAKMTRAEKFQVEVSARSPFFGSPLEIYSRPHHENKREHTSIASGIKSRNKQPSKKQRCRHYNCKKQTQNKPTARARSDNLSYQ